jgi:hypothetical protein
LKLNNKVSEKVSVSIQNMYPQFVNRLGKFCAFAVAILILPAMAFAGHDNGKGNDFQNNGKGNDSDGHISVVPEANTGWVLIPFVGAVLLFSWRQFTRAKA